jgi:hypothetical protein
VCIHKTAKNHSSARILIAERAIPLLISYGDAKVAASMSEVCVLPYAKKITNVGGTGASNFRKRSAVINKDLSDKLFDFGAAGFGKRWCNLTAKSSDLKGLNHTRFRFYVETKNKEHHTIDEQRVVSERLLHDDNVAAQNYMATSETRMRKGAELVQGLLDRVNGVSASATTALSSQVIYAEFGNCVLHTLLVCIIVNTSY